MESIGSKLKKAREKKHLSLEEVSRKTKIHPSILEAIEEDRAKNNLSKVYVKGFVKNYAQLVGLNGEELVLEYMKESSGEVSPLSPTALELPSWDEENNALWLRRTLITIVIIGTLSLIGLGFSKIRWRMFLPSPDLYQELSLKKGSLVPYPFRISKDEPLKLELCATENTWATIRSDGQLMYQGLLTKGKEEGWVAKRRFELSLSDGGCVRFRLNRRSLGIAGEKGKPLEKLLMTHEGWGLDIKE